MCIFHKYKLVAVKPRIHDLVQTLTGAVVVKDIKTTELCYRCVKCDNIKLSSIDDHWTLEELTKKEI